MTDERCPKCRIGLRVSKPCMVQQNGDIHTADRCIAELRRQLEWRETFVLNPMFNAASIDKMNAAIMLAHAALGTAKDGKVTPPWNVKCGDVIGTLCMCDPSVGAVPCPTCAIYTALVAFEALVAAVTPEPTISFCDIGTDNDDARREGQHE